MHESLGDIILHHVTNGLDHPLVSLHFWGIDFSITKHVLMLWISAFLLTSIAIFATRRYRKNINVQPRGISQIFEMLIEFIRDEIVKPNIGSGKEAKLWTPMLTTFFAFILTCNFIGLIPFFDFVPGGSSTETGNLYMTGALAFITFLSIITAGVMKHGFFGHWKNLAPHGVPIAVLPLIIVIEVFGMFLRPIVLMVRLGANMTAGHIGMIAIFALPMILSQLPQGAQLSVGFVAVLLNTGIFFLEIIVSLVQAYVFTLLSSVFIGMAINPEH